VRGGPVDEVQSLMDRSVGDVLRAARLRVGLTRAGVALRCGLGTELYMRIEQGRESPTLRTLRRIWRVLEQAEETLVPDVERAARARCEAGHPPMRARLRERDGRGSSSTRGSDASGRPSRARGTRECRETELSVALILLVLEGRRGSLSRVVSSLLGRGVRH
jgi:transcriptional regulator with XRE-family HTH domain